MSEGLASQSAPSLERRLAVVATQFLKYRGIVGRIHHHRHRGVVFCGGSDQSGTADVNVLYGLFDTDVRSPNCPRKGIQINHHQPDRRNPMLLQRRPVLRIIMAG